MDKHLRQDLTRGAIIISGLAGLAALLQLGFGGAIDDTFRGNVPEGYKYVVTGKAGDGFDKETNFYVKEGRRRDEKVHLGVFAKDVGGGEDTFDMYLDCKQKMYSFDDQEFVQFESTRTVLGEISELYC